MNNIYKAVSKVNCGGNTMVTVMIRGKAACVMTEKEYQEFVKIHRKSNSI